MKKMVKKVSLLSLATLGAISVASCKKTTSEIKWYEVDENVSVHADGVRKSYANASYEERTKILGLLEKYAVENNLTGLTIYGDGVKGLHSERLTTQTNWEYVNGFGFGVISNGSITADMENETNANWKRYYHTFETSKPATLNYQNDKGSVVGALLDYVAGSYFTTRLCQKADGSWGYEWCGDLADEFSYEGQNVLLAPVNGLNADGKANEWKIKVKLGSDLVYHTLSSKNSEFEGRQATKEDYIMPYLLLWNQSLGFARATDNFNTSQQLEGSQEYYNATKEADTVEKMLAAYHSSGLDKKLFVDDEGFLHITYKVAKNHFYAMYNATSTMYAPVPAEFISKVTPTKWGNIDDSNGSTPVDTYLSTGAYAVEAWTNSELVFKRTARQMYAPFNIAGIKETILEGQTKNKETAYNEFKLGKLDQVAIPSTKLKEEANNPLIYQSGTSSTYKINYNTCNAETWEYLFGENGVITQTEKANYWDLKPAMQNDSFVKGLSLALDRKTFAETYGKTPSAEFFGDSYLSDPENGVIYNTTKEHADATVSIYPTDAAKANYGYDKAAAQQLFTKAARELTENGDYKSGDTITIEVAWQSQAQKDDEGATLKTMFEDAFNNSEAKTVYGLTLNVVSMAVQEWSDVYFQKMMIGQFDLAFGSISGNALDPLNFLEVLKSDNSSTFTLNWGTDTNTVDSSMFYDGSTWSFDALWQAADSSALVSNGKRVNYVDTKVQKSHHNEDGTRDVVVKYAKFKGDDYRVAFDASDVSIVWYNAQGESNKLSVEEANIKVEAGKITFTLPEFVESNADQVAFELTFNIEHKEGDKWVIAESGKTEIGNSFNFSPKLD